MANATKRPSFLRRLFTREDAVVTQEDSQDAAIDRNELQLIAEELKQLDLAVKEMAYAKRVVSIGLVRGARQLLPGQILNYATGTRAIWQRALQINIQIYNEAAQVSVRERTELAQLYKHRNEIREQMMKSQDRSSSSRYRQMLADVNRNLSLHRTGMRVLAMEKRDVRRVSGGADGRINKYLNELISLLERWEQNRPLSTLWLSQILERINWVISALNEDIREVEQIRALTRADLKNELSEAKMDIVETALERNIR